MGWGVAPGSAGVAGDMAGLVTGGPFQSCCAGICRDRDWERIILKLFFLKAKDKESRRHQQLIGVSHKQSLLGTEQENFAMINHGYWPYHWEVSNYLCLPPTSLHEIQRSPPGAPTCGRYELQWLCLQMPQKTDRQMQTTAVHDGSEDNVKSARLSPCGDSTLSSPNLNSKA